MFSIWQFYFPYPLHCEFGSLDSYVMPDGKNDRPALVLYKREITVNNKVSGQKDFLVPITKIKK